mmetsp:Transcript_10661/g.25101  ORF Transcript_10661/g.25101 Transcript_10661/m.25101 type:complete len:242 (+) Transcript_10661:977-1702(+)
MGVLPLREAVQLLLVELLLPRLQGAVVLLHDQQLLLPRLRLSVPLLTLLLQLQAMLCQLLRKAPRLLFQLQSRRACLHLRLVRPALLLPQLLRLRLESLELARGLLGLLMAELLQFLHLPPHGLLIRHLAVQLLLPDLLLTQGLRLPLLQLFFESAGTGLLIFQLELEPGCLCLKVLGFAALRLYRPAGAFQRNLPARGRGALHVQLVLQLGLRKARLGFLLLQLALHAASGALHLRDLTF